MTTIRWHVRPTGAPPLTLALAALLIAALAAMQPAAADLLAPGSRANIVVILTDDLDETLLQSAFEADLLPTIEQVFAAEGIRMRNSFVSNSECCPSRATFLSGQYTHNHGVLTNAAPFAYPAFDDSSTVATWMRAAGYLTGFTGKYLNGYWGQRDLDGDGEIGVGETGYVPPGWSWWHGLLDPTTYDVYGYYILDGVTGAVEYYPDRYQTDVLAEKAVGIVDAAEAEDDGAPFFLWVSTLAPHSEESPETLACRIDTGSMTVDIGTIRPAPRHVGAAAAVTMPKPSNFNEPDISDKPAWLRNYVPSPLEAGDVACLERIYRDKLESLMAVDDLVRDLLDALERNGETDRTLLLFTSDNGFEYGRHRLARPSKTYPYEESIRVPFYVRDPSDLGPRSIDLPVLNNDIAPTLADIAGAVPTHIADGRSLLPALGTTPPAQWRRRIMVEHFYKYVVPTYAALRTFGQTPLTYVEYKTAGGAGGEWVGCGSDVCELYFIKGDPYQTLSQHGSIQVQAIIPGLSELLTAMRGCRGATCRALEDR